MVTRLISLTHTKIQKMVILRKWKYPIFVPKVYKIKKLRQLFLSKCPQNNFKILYFDGFLRFFDIFLKFKKNGEKSPAKITKSTKLRQFLMSILKGLKWFSEKYSREEKSSFYYSFSISYFFFALWASKRHKKWNEPWESSLLQKEVYAKSVGFVAKIQQMLQKKFPTIIWYLVYFQIVSGCYINMFQRKTSENLSN